MHRDPIQTAVAGVSGYAGLELARLLLHHPALKGRPPVFVGRDAEPVRLTEMHPQLADNNGSSGLLGAVEGARCEAALPGHAA
jgi:N-acetyl-gamma-glutamyl-phosphate reductase